MATSFSLSKADRDCILAHVKGLDDLFVARLQRGTSDAARMNFEMRASALERLVAGLSRAYEAASDTRTRESLCAVMQSIEESVQVEPGDLEPPPPNHPMHPLLEKAGRIIQERGVETLEEAQAILDELQHEYNRTPQDILGGLSPSEAARLFCPDWRDPYCGLRLRDDLEMEALAHVEIFANTRLLLEMLQEAGGTKATAKGNLNAKFAKAYAGRMVMEEEHLRDNFDAINKQWREDHVRFLGDTRYVAQLAGLLRKYKGSFLITKQGAHMLKDESAGTLYCLLFFTFFQRFDLACLSGGHELPMLQDTIAFSFRALGQHAREWTREDDLLQILFLPEIYSEAPVPVNEWHDPLKFIAWRRLIMPLQRFGLVEKRPDRRPGAEYKSEIRITPLFDQFLSFDLRPFPMPR